MSKGNGAKAQGQDEGKGGVAVMDREREDGGTDTGKTEIVDGQKFRVVTIPEGVTAESVAEKKAKASQPELPFCGDGCGARARKGRTFLPGHDAKLHSLLQKVANGEAELPKALKGKVSLPEANMRTVYLTVQMKVVVPKDEQIQETMERIHKALDRKGWSEVNVQKLV